MPRPSVNDVFRVEVFQNVGSELTMNVLHLRCTFEGSLTAAEEGDGALQVVYDTYDALAPQMSEDWRVVQIASRLVSPGSGIPSTIVFGGAEAIVGGIESEIIPSASAMLISFYSSNNSRSGRGRVYLPGLPESAQNEGQLVEGVWSAFQGIATAQFQGEKTPATGGGSKYRYTVFGGGAGPGADQDVQGALVRPNLATQRRRRAFPGFGG